MIVPGDGYTPPLIHFGVKGMHWGVRKAAPPANAGYTARQRGIDRRDFGNRGEKRINEKLNSGIKRGDARLSEQRRDAYQRLALVGATIAVQVLATSGGISAGSLPANRGASAAKAIASKAHKLTYAKSRGGVFKITTL
jgi:hypothetical protein